MNKKTLTEILSDFEVNGEDEKNRLKYRQCVTIWLPPEMKARYDKLQKSSGRRLSKKAREVLLALIEAAEALSA